MGHFAGQGDESHDPAYRADNHKDGCERVDEKPDIVSYHLGYHLFSPGLQYPLTQILTYTYNFLLLYIYLLEFLKLSFKPFFRPAAGLTL